MKRTHRWGRLVFLGLVTWLLTGSSAMAQTFVWNNASGGFFNSGPNWSPAGGPPSVGETVGFHLPNTYTVIFGSNPTVGIMTQTNGEVTFALSGRTFSLPAINLGNAAGLTASLTLGNGTVNLTDPVFGITIGNFNGTGILTVGADSTFNTPGRISVGANSGTGTLAVQNGGHVAANTIQVGFGNAGSGFGTATITGAGSTATTSSFVTVGDDGFGQMTVSSGATVTVGNALTIGNKTVSDGSLAVTGSGTLFTVTSGAVTIGNSGTGSLNVSDGATMSALGNSYIVGGARAGQLDISSGGSVSGAFATLGQNTGGIGTINVQDSGSSLNLSGNLNFGAAGTGRGTLNVTNGGTVQTANAFLAQSSTSTGNVVNVDGIASRWNAAQLHIGQAGSAVVNVSNGGTIRTLGALTIADLAGATGNLTVNQGTVNANAGLYVGGTSVVPGGTGTFVMNDGANVNVTGETKIWAGGTATLNGGTLTTNSFTRLGALNFNNGTIIVNGGNFQNGAAAAPLALNGNSPTLKLMGPGTAATNITNLTVAVTQSATLEVADGAVISTSGSTLGLNAGTNGTATITGSNSLWNVGGNLTVGNSGRGILNITNGGSLSTSAAVDLGAIAGSRGDVNISGNNSILTTSTLRVGVAGQGFMTLSDGGRLVTNGPTTIGGTNSGRVTLNAGGRWDTGQNITFTPAQGVLHINGGTLNSSGTLNRAGLLFDDGALNINGLFVNGAAPTSFLLNSTSAGHPIMTIGNGGSTSNITTATIGATSAATLNVINTGSFTTISDLAVGTAAGGVGTVNVNNTGQLIVNSNLLLGSNIGGVGTLNVGPQSVAAVKNNISLAPGGTLNIQGGNVQMSSFSNNGGAVNFTSGTVTFTAPTALGSTHLDSFVGAGHVLGPQKNISLPTGSILLSPVTISGGGLFSSGDFTNGGTIQLTSGSLTTAGAFNNNAGRTAQVSGSGQLAANEGMANAGTLLLSNNLNPTSGGVITNTGTIRGTGFVGNDLTNSAGGQVHMTTGNRLEFQGANNSNAGLVSMIGGELVFTGPVTNVASTGLISGRDAILRTGGITNNGAIAITAGQMDIYGDITNNVGGRITISAGALATFWDDVTIASGASSVQASAAGPFISRAVFFGSYNGGITGGGAAFIEGDHRPGNSPGLVTFGGDLFYGGLSTTHLELGGALRGTQYDAVNVLGSTLSISGILDLQLINGFNPSAASTFLLFDNQGPNPVQGIFDGLPEGAFFSAGGNSLFQISYHGGNGNDIVLTAVPEPSTLVLLGMVGLGGVGYARLRRGQRLITSWENEVTA